ncbi:hypothetical protein A2335_00940 [Candidatus Peregrinibacteria bacterium RIFOXYB2_FULL_32_7]|nr:MAG: hypothetical protein A2335_00940 [Candidatus Peregrinibacteria bacterium RIFOXYB2_FULL_32_7]
MLHTSLDQSKINTLQLFEAPADNVTGTGSSSSIPEGTQTVTTARAKVETAMNPNAEMEKTIRPDVLSRCIDVIIQVTLAEKSTITEATELHNDLKTDSVDIIDIVFNLETEFSIEIPETDFASWQTVGDVTDYIISRLITEGTGKQPIKGNYLHISWSS